MGRGDESDSVRLARIEEGLVRLHERITTNHDAQMSVLTPVVEQTYKNKDDIIRINRDHKWIYTLIMLVALPSVFTGVELYLWYHQHNPS